MAMTMCSATLNQNLELIDKATEAANTTLDYPRTPVYRTRRAGYALNQKKLIKNLKKDAVINAFDTVFNNHNENVSIKCNSGFFLEIFPSFHDLAQKCVTPMIFNHFRIVCTNEKTSLDHLNLHVNNLYLFDVLSLDNDAVVAHVSVHIHITTKLIQLQGSRLVDWRLHLSGFTITSLKILLREKLNLEKQT